MAIWSGIGINYGHQSLYDPMQVESDFSFLQSCGITRLRIAMPQYDNTNNRIVQDQDMIRRALSRGFYVVWGVVAGYGANSLTASRWSAAKSYILNTIAPWAQSVGISELCLTNESELSVDGTTITTTQIRADIRAMASTIKAGGFAGRLSYSTSASPAYMTPWTNEGIGALDLIGWNSYDTYANFNTRNGIVASAFGGKTYISEFGGITHGYPDFNDETLYYNDTVSRINSMKNADISAGYFFCYRDGGYGVPPNSFALVKTDGTVHMARQAVCGA